MSSLEKLVDMGFNEETAKAALEVHGFDLERSINALLGQSTISTGTQAVQASISQYDVENGRSACTCICLEASLSILEQLSNGAWEGSPDEVANTVNIGVITYESLIGVGTLAVEHTSVAEVLAAVARYRDVLEPATAKGCHQGLLGSDMSFAKILADIRSERKDKRRPIAVAITKPPETVVAFLPPEPQESRSGATERSTTPLQWLLFDSHPRAQLGLVGASVLSFGEESALVSALTNIFPAVDLGTDNVMASMYNMVDCTPLTLKSRSEG